MDKLNKRQKSILRKSSRPAVLQTFTKLGKHFRHNRLIGKNNRYSNNCIVALQRDIQPGRMVNHGHLAQYITMSAMLHCADGWSFLGRVIDCHSRGDGNIARHLAYYAELRGAIALLAAEGIGIFNKRHFVLESSGNCQILPQHLGTHRITWLALEHWADLQRSADLLAQIISPGGIPLGEWLGSFGSGSNIHPIGSEWLKSWGLDLKRLSEDRDARNEASYRPTRLIYKAPLDILKSTHFLHNFWIMCEPSGPTRFEFLDRHLLRLSVEQAFQAIHDIKVQDNVDEFKKDVEKMLDNIEPSGLSKEEWKKFLVRESEPDTPPLIIEAAGNAPMGDPHHHIQVMARATLLLRVATGACAKLLRETGLDRTHVEFWWKSFGEELGLWEIGNEPSELTDLWADIETALKETRDWVSGSTGIQLSFARWRKEQSHPISILGECERVALWGLGL